MNKLKAIFGVCLGMSILFIIINQAIVYKGNISIFFTLRQSVLLYTNTTWKNTPITQPKDLDLDLDRKQCQKKTSFKSRPIHVNLTSPSWQDLHNLTAHLKPGGRFEPSDCADPDRVAIIVPYRNRESQLKAFLQHMHPFLQRQHLQYTIYIIELAAGIPFNRGLLMNIGFLEATKRGNFQCFIFHDVDLFPENDANMYTCPSQPGHPRHLSVAVDKFSYKLPYSSLVGGATVILRNDFMSLNGFSNLYFRWGGEDDDLAIRIQSRNMTVTRYPMEIGRYMMLKHAQEEINRHSAKLLDNPKARIPVDGLNTLEYSVLSTDAETTLYTRILVTIDIKKFENLIKGIVATTNSRPKKDFVWYKNIAAKKPLKKDSV